MNDVLALLVTAKKRIENPKHWTQHTFARAGRVSVCFTSLCADSWCATGAIFSLGGLALKKAQQHLRDASNALFGLSPVTVDDCKGHEAVMQMYDKAIQLAQEKAHESNGC